MERDGRTFFGVTYMLAKKAREWNEGFLHRISLLYSVSFIMHHAFFFFGIKTIGAPNGGSSRVDSRVPRNEALAEQQQCRLGAQALQRG
jgi:hypothetical protein